MKRILQIIQANDFSVQPRKMRPQIASFFSYQSNRALRTSCSSLYYLGEITGVGTVPKRECQKAW